MKNTGKIAVVALLAVAVAATFAMRGAKRAEYVPPGGAPPAAQDAPQARLLPEAPAPAVATTVPAPRARPRLLELGSMRCQACLEMAKVLEALRASQGEKLQVDFIDVFEQPDAPEQYKISLIPTQILYDGSGKEIFRHTGYFSHDDILAKYRELGVRL
jgi:thioredoxin 1